MSGSSGIGRCVRDLGGIASYAEIVSLGWSQDDLRFARDRGSVITLRHGWCGSPDLSPLVRVAWAAGGPLACISALLYWGEAQEDDAGHDSAVVHVALGRHAKPPLTRGKLACDVGIVWHYTELGDRRHHAVDPSVARRQRARCRLPGAGHPSLVRVDRANRQAERRARTPAEHPPWGDEA